MTTMGAQERSQGPKEALSATELLTVAEAAERARVSASTIKRAYKSGELRIFGTPGGGIVRIHADSLDAWITAHSHGGTR